MGIRPLERGLRAMKPEAGRARWPNRQPVHSPGEQRREDDVERDEIDAARAWLRHVEAGRIAC